MGLVWEEGWGGGLCNICWVFGGLGGSGERMRMLCMAMVDTKGSSLLACWVIGEIILLKMASMQVLCNP